MDTTLYIIIAVIVVIIIAVVVLVLIGNGQKKNVTNEHSKQDLIEDQKESTTTKRFQQVLSDDALSGEMEKRAEEILTKYTSGSGDGIPEVEKLLEGDPNNVDLLDWLAFMYYSNDNIDKAIETYKKALSIKYDNENQHYYLANSYYKKGMMSEARKEWSEVIRLNPSSKIAKNAQERIDFINSQGK
ncbi:MAG: tetratricopeptide repeat protein [Candidatus Riflebacteria bacterium]|nr:tetratricopeptide repeat protein [Candidatus Riflebacteria bacterium]